MRPELAAVAATQSGLISRRQAIAAGYRERELRTLTGVHGRWVIVRRGVYVDRTIWEALGEDGRWRLRDLAAHLSMTAPHVLSHDSAARALRLPFLRPKVMVSHVTRPGVWGSRTEHGVKHHLSRRPPSVDATVDGTPLTGLARTAVDLGREHGFVTGVTACDAVLRRGVSRADLSSELASMSCWPNISGARSAVEAADPGADNIAESLARLLVAELVPGLGQPRTQFPVRTSSGTFWCDLVLAAHFFELDGRIKYRLVEDGGVAQRPVEEVVWEEKRRQTEICAEGVGLSRIVWDDLFGAGRVRARRRLRGELAVSLERFGDRLPEHLEQTARALADERRRRIYGR